MGFRVADYVGIVCRLFAPSAVYHTDFSPLSRFPRQAAAQEMVFEIYT